FASPRFRLILQDTHISHDNIIARNYADCPDALRMNFEGFFKIPQCKMAALLQPVTAGEQCSPTDQYQHFQPFIKCGRDIIRYAQTGYSKFRIIFAGYA
ncbi:MAG: hypothetical protein IJ779_00475, partial [Ruminococcus sp.]|nr:hypothetical protein [Ruminococcus sp.]